LIGVVEPKFKDLSGAAIVVTEFDRWMSDEPDVELWKRHCGIQTTQQIERNIRETPPAERLSFVIVVYTSSSSGRL
jgi:hypothetical protein